MTSVTDSDLKEIKDAILTLSKQIAENDKKTTEVISLVRVEIADLKGELKATNAKIDGLDKSFRDGLSNLEKRLSTLEFFYRAISLGLFGLFAAAVLKYYFDHPFS